jgi:hypothetical protein
MVGGTTPSAPMAGHPAPAQGAPQNSMQNASPSALGIKADVAVPSKPSTAYRDRGFHSAPGGHPTYRDANGPI